MSEDIRPKIGKRIYALRRNQNLTQLRLAKLIGVNASYIGPLEKGLKCPSITVLEKIAEVLEQPLFTFFVEDGQSLGGGDHIHERMAAILGLHPTEEKMFLLTTLESLSDLLRSRQSTEDDPEGESKDAATSRELSWNGASRKLRAEVPRRRTSAKSHGPQRSFD